MKPVDIWNLFVLLMNLEAARREYRHERRFAEWFDLGGES